MELLAAAGMALQEAGMADPEWLQVSLFLPPILSGFASVLLLSEQIFAVVLRLP